MRENNNSVITRRPLDTDKLKLKVEIAHQLIQQTKIPDGEYSMINKVGLQ